MMMTDLIDKKFSPYNPTHRILNIQMGFDCQSVLPRILLFHRGRTIESIYTNSQVFEETKRLCKKDEGYAKECDWYRKNTLLCFRIKRNPKATVN